MRKESKIHYLSSKVFCILPWIHIHSLPNGNVSPCCISYPNEFTGVVKSNTSLLDLVNSPKQSELRLSMLDGKESAICQNCYNFESTGADSFRTHSNKIFAQFFDDAVKNTDINGKMRDFKMRYFDFRFDNICNFKCRSCTADYSSQWEQENKNNIDGYFVIKNEKSQLLFEDILEQIPFMHEAYFAGGEPLITEEHYIILEEMLRKNKQDIFLKYNTNLSNFKFKDKDIINLWKQFKHPVQIGASIDHYGSRAEYIRHGTNWSKLEDNIRILKNNLGTKLNFNISTVLSIYNTLTIYDFYSYMVNNQLYNPDHDGTFQLYHITHPPYLSPHLLSKEDKSNSIEQLNQLNSFFKNVTMNKAKFNSICSVLESTIRFLENDTDLSNEIPNFKKETVRLDTIRKENLVETFPELQRFIQ